MPVSSAGLTVEHWMITSGRPAATPSGPVRTPRTAMASESIVITTGAASAAASGVAAGTAPLSAIRAVFAGSRSQTVT
jgi:hypothetical protein